ncbi:MAG TPA: S9 family peptidase [Anaerolineae bacterium]
MAKKQVAPYGSWKSPITSDLIVAGTVKLDQLVLDGEAVYWTEGRPSESGRYTIVKWTPGGGREEMTPAGFNVRTRVHEYGGGAFTVDEGPIYFSNFVDQQLYRQYPDNEPEPITPMGPFRFADSVIDRQRNRLICVREEHGPGQEPVNTLVSLDLNKNEHEGLVLVSGNDFYAWPRLSPDGRRLVWLTWNHPDMPWDGTELWLGEFSPDGSLANVTMVAGGPNESILQPEWSPDGVLHFVSDRTNWWNLYRWHDGHVEALCEMEAEFGRPQWLFGQSTYGFESATSVICAYTQHGLWRLARLDTQTGTLSNIETPYSSIDQIHVDNGFAYFIGGSATRPGAIIRLDLNMVEMSVLRHSVNLSVEPGYLSTPEPIQFPTENGLAAYGIYYPPRNQDYEAPEGERPPLVVMSHGGPTSATSTMLNLEKQFFTSRGLAVLDVNYRGSTGYGRDYRQQLYGQWGIADVEDCINGARYLVNKDLVDGNRLAIRGGSAGGYTTLCALTFHDTFSAGASYFGVSDLELLAKETHKFESRYLDKLVGPYPEARDRYVERSPIHFSDRITCPLILFQGLEDEVVPPNQAQKMFEAVRAKELPVAYLAFAGEQHGFRRAENIKRVLDAELYFYGKVFGFELATPSEPVPIENL